MNVKQDVIDNIIHKQLPLTETELGVIWDCIGDNPRFKRFGDISYMLREDWLNDRFPIKERASKNIEVESDKWRAELENECELSISRLNKFYYYINPLEFCAVMLWRGALAYTKALFNYKIKTINMRVKRNEETLQIETLMPMNKIDMASIKNGYYRKYIIPDVMLATGNSSATAIDILKQFGIPEDCITVLCVVAAPEGVFRLLEQYPKIRIIANTLDNQLNENGYIVRGLGDAGDKYFYQNTIQSFVPYMGTFTSEQWKYLEELLK